MVEVFKTNVQEDVQAKNLVALLLHHFPDSRINFDLDDCDKILRVEGNGYVMEKVIMLVTENGFACKALD